MVFSLAEALDAMKPRIYLKRFCNEFLRLADRLLQLLIDSLFVSSL
jgi:hypothetical protein